MKKLTHLDKYVGTPDVGFYGGFEYDGEDILLCEDHDVDGDYNFKVTQKIESDVLVTDLERTFKRNNDKAVTESSHMEVELEKGQLLVYVEGTGFVIPEYSLCKIDEAIERYKLLK